MANEVTILDSTKDAYGAVTRRVLYWYTISPAITDSTGAKIIPQGRAHLSDDAARYLTEADKALIDTGDAGFEVRPAIVQTAGETNANFRTRILADHQARMTWWLDEQRAKYALSGTGATG